MQMTDDLERQVTTEDVEFRKLQLLGRSSIAVTLPKKWIQLLGLKPGDVVIVRRQGSSIIIEPYTSNIEQSLHAHEIKISSDKLWRCLRKIVGLYLSGASMITIQFAPDAIGLKHIVKSFLREKLPGAEILDEKYDQLLVRFLTNLEELPLRKILKRMSSIAIGILKDGLKLLVNAKEGTNSDESQDVTMRDEEIDRLYLLLYRLVNQGILNQRMLAKLDAEDPRELVAALMVAKSIERCGDHATRVAYFAKALSTMTMFREVKDDTIEKLVKLGNSTCNILKEATQSFVDKDVEKAQAILERRLEIRKISIQLVDTVMKRACPLSMVCANEMMTYVVLMIESIRRFLAYSYDIAEITVDTYSR
jgi:phosphate uptake regulator